ncbi:hypothetical protein ACH50O_20500 [Methylomonas sp. 2BW1-5-20]|uniref:hypothetical protein n=1 Tax=Methylomonas sp. 2BW1-5-20 TaxID=3376686 RepID=UPI0040519625
MTRLLKKLPNLCDAKEIVIVVLLTLISVYVFYKLYGFHDRSLVTVDNVWFQADLSRVFENMTNQLSEGHYRLKVHPLFSILTYPPVTLLVRAGLGQYVAVQIFTTFVASFWTLSLYVLFRFLGCRLFDALVISILGASSAAALFWLSVPESYAIGSISIISCLALVAIANQKRLPDWIYVAVSSFSLSVTTTNWMIGTLSVIVEKTWRRAILISIIAFSIVAMIWGVEKYLFPHAVFFIGDKEEASYMFSPGLKRILSVGGVFVFHSILSPSLNVINDNDFGWPMLSIQNSLPGSNGVLNFIGTIIWLVLFGLGLWSLFTLKKHLALRIVLGFSFIGQFALHILYGEETFLYSLHFAPLLLTLVALITLGALRLPAICLLIALIPIVVINNWSQLKAADVIATSPRNQVINQMQLRPQDPWPRSQGHVLLAMPGSQERKKAYHEPGGGFSPGAGSFGVSVWVNAPDGKLLTTSDTIGQKQITQSFDWSDIGHKLPGIRTETEYYRTAWTSNGWGAWQLKLATPETTNSIPSLLIRGVGPSGGPIHELSWDGESLHINKLWSMSIHPAPKAVYLGDENSSDWKTLKNQQTTITSETGWGFARIELDGGSTKEWLANIQDEHPLVEPVSSNESALHDLVLNVPDEGFSNCLNAQIGHLMMSTVDGETRPGDPMNYPLEWQRDGAYILVALARAGKLDTAKLLSKEFAKRDFFGGFGPEADAPGLSLWALGTLASQLKSESYDWWLWPHANRKVAFIEKMLTTRSKITQKITGPIVPKHTIDAQNTLLAEPAQDGLIVGKMDYTRPVLFINAVSYRGMMEASRLAERLKKFDEAKRWKATAEKIKEAWGAGFKPPLSDNARTYISALWPSWIASDKRESLQNYLEQRWLVQHDASNTFKTSPLWTYFDVAEAHQWLFLGHPERTWSTVRWFWNNQSSPGLYSWWEGQGEENSFRKWESVRGWVNPPNVTPHYWTAAEMALLQFDMLGYIDEGGDEPTLVIGAGIPVEWLSKEIDVRNLKTNDASIDWHWSGSKMKVTIHSEKQIKIRLSNGFPKNSTLEVVYSEV